MAADTRERIVTATNEAFQRQGYAGSGLKEISVASGAPFGSLYHFFPGGKVELADETLRWSGAQYQALVEAVWDVAPADPAKAMRFLFDSAAQALATATSPTSAPSPPSPWRWPAPTNGCAW